MIEKDNAANDRSVNSLINFETVKFFGMERMECGLLEDSIISYNKVPPYMMYVYVYASSSVWSARNVAS